MTLSLIATSGIKHAKTKTTKSKKTVKSNKYLINTLPHLLSSLRPRLPKFLDCRPKTVFSRSYLAAWHQWFCSRGRTTPVYPSIWHWCNRPHWTRFTHSNSWSKRRRVIWPHRTAAFISRNSGRPSWCQTLIPPMRKEQTGRRCCRVFSLVFCFTIILWLTCTRECAPWRCSRWIDRSWRSYGRCWLCLRTWWQSEIFGSSA